MRLLPQRLDHDGRGASLKKKPHPTEAEIRQALTGPEMPLRHAYGDLRAVKRAAEKMA